MREPDYDKYLDAELHKAQKEERVHTWRNCPCGGCPECADEGEDNES